MYSMYNAPSDRDYYGAGEPPDEERCFCCGANESEEHEENCEANRSVEEPQPEPDETPLISSGRKVVTMVIDGACRGSPGPGGWACVLRFGTHQRQYSGHHPDTTNNRMELEAAFKASGASKKRVR